MAKLDPEILAHLEWIGFVRPTGLVVSALALARAGAILDRRDAEGQRLLCACVEERAFDPKEGPVPHLPDFRAFAESVLGWSFSPKGYAGTADTPIPPELEVPIPGYGETLRPDLAVRELEPKGGASPWQLLVRLLEPGEDFDRVVRGHGQFEASAHGRMERLLRQTGVPAGLLFNGRALRLLSAPRGESSGWLDFRVADMVQTAGRPISTALRLLLGQSRLLGLPRAQRLAALLEDSRKFQNEVSERLAEQVLHSLYELLRGFQAAHDASKGELLRQPLAEHADEVYRALLTVILRLVFLLYSEERDMLPEDETFLRYYSLAGLYERLREDAALFPDTMDQRYGAWAQLLVLFRMIHDGADSGAMRLPKRHGVLFDPDRFKFLEGRPSGGARQIHERIEPPLVPDGTIYRALEKLLVLDGERISYRALDVEQIGSVYETMMGFRLETATGRSAAIKAQKKQGAPTAVDLGALLGEPAAKREKWLQDGADRKLTDAVKKAVVEATTVEGLHAALLPVIDPAATPDLVPEGAMVLQPSEERRRSGSHYTPRALTEPIVRTTLEPILARLRGADGQPPQPAQILDLKVCDPAMGSGAFLVDLGEVPESAGLAEESNEERKAAKKGFFPSSMGLSFLVPKEARALTVTVCWGDYVKTEVEGADGKPVSVWQRQPREAKVPVALTGADEPVVHDVPGSGGLQLHVADRLISAGDLEEHIPRGTRSVSVFLVNHRAPVKAEPDIAYVFQPEVEVRSDRPFVPRPDLRGARAAEWDEQVADLHYADTPAYAAGHGVSAEWEIVDGACHLLRTAWIPTAEVEKTATVDVPGVELSMEALGALADGQAAAAVLRPLVGQYRNWIEARRAGIAALQGMRRETAEELLRLAGAAAGRIERGIAVLASDLDALDAFRVANRVVARALRKRLGIETPCWRAFQLAFILLNLPGLADPHDPNRETVDLLFFPTGGGKTEAYLGLAAFAMVLRRLRHLGEKGLAGAGVSVIMRYTLRLLTLDQLARAAGLVCALELEREKHSARYGGWPFEIGLWVGKAATPNILGRRGDNRSDAARAKVRHFKADPKGKPSPIPLENCPWCGTRFGPDSFALLPNDDEPRELRIVCTNFECDFTRDRALPIVAVDEPIYQRLPAFLIATVDKFASLPWVGQTGVLLGGADRHDTTGFYGAAEPRKGTRLATALPPPDLVIQDELHLISGPLGTMVGLYEAAIEALCVREIDGRAVRPKIVASTATVRRAQDQIQALFARPQTQVFPPPGPDRRDSFFARTVPSSQVPARLYLGIASQGKSPKVLMRKAWLALMGATERAYHDAGGERNEQNPADPYMTVLGYFNSLRELGGARRILEEEVQNTIKAYGARKRIGEEPGLFRDRKTFSEVVELTSRVSTDKVADARRRLECGFREIKQRVDCAIATNMISVGLDIPRLGLMVVLGQPKTHAEYIQATSRVGRTDDRPGLVVTLLNIHKPRDRSHYERFRHYHETFYRSVEVGSVTPFSARALDRGFVGALVGLARHAKPELTPPLGVERIADVRVALERRLLDDFLERVRQQPIEEEDERAERLRSVQNRVVDLLDSWRKIFEDYRTAGVALQYQKYELKQPRPLLRETLDKDFESEHHRKFRANRSLRDVEPEVNLYLKDLSGVQLEDPA